MISLKLKAIAFFIDKSDSVVDIGCDHAYLDIYLIENNLCNKIIASDINRNALDIAKNNIDKYNLNKKIKTILSDGLKNIDTKNLDTVVIAGMGTKTIKSIIDEKEKFQSINKIILSSNNDLYELRKYMMNNNYSLVDEKIIYEKKHYYVVSKYIKGKQKLKKNILLFGLYKKENIEYYKYLIADYSGILKKIPRRNFSQRFKLIKNIRRLKKIIK